MKALIIHLKLSLELRGQLLMQPKALSQEANNLHTLEANPFFFQCLSQEAPYLQCRGYTKLLLPSPSQEVINSLHAQARILHALPHS